MIYWLLLFKESEYINERMFENIKSDNEELLKLYSFKKNKEF
jgi:hypothetical protein